MLRTVCVLVSPVCPAINQGPRETECVEFHKLEQLARDRRAMYGWRGRGFLVLRDARRGAAAEELHASVSVGAVPPQRMHSPFFPPLLLQPPLSLIGTIESTPGCAQILGYERGKLYG